MAWGLVDIIQALNTSKLFVSWPLIFTCNRVFCMVRLMSLTNLGEISKSSITENGLSSSILSYACFDFKLPVFKSRTNCKALVCCCSAWSEGRLIWLAHNIFSIAFSFVFNIIVSTLYVLRDIPLKLSQRSLSSYLQMGHITLLCQSAGVVSELQILSINSCLNFWDINFILNSFSRHFRESSRPINLTFEHYRCTQSHPYFVCEDVVGGGYRVSEAWVEDS